ADLACEADPSPARAPDGIARLAFAAVVLAAHARVIHPGNDGRLAAGISKRSGLVRRLLQLAGDTQAEQSFFVIVEDDALIERCKLGYSVNDAAIRACGKYEQRLFAQERVAIGREPLRLDFQFAALFAARHALDACVADRAVMASLCRLDGVGVVPKVKAVHVAVIEPQADLVRMIRALAGTRFKRVAARHERAGGGAQRIKHGLLDALRPDVSGERLAVYEDIDAMRCCISDDAHAGLCRFALRIDM